jgi:putative ABC transport system permease protein
MSTRRRPGDDFDREIRAHLELETARLIDAGVPPDEARAQAVRAFGNVTRVRERYYERGRTMWLDQLRQDFHCAVRSLRRYPLAAAVAVVSLAGGIGGTTVTLMVRDIVFRNPPPLYQDPSQLSRIQAGTPARPIMPLGSPVPAGLFRRWLGAVDVPLGAAGPQRNLDVRAGDRTVATAVRGATPGLFELLGAAPELGRFFAPTPAAADAAAPVVLSYRAWDRLFDRRTDAVGQTIWIRNQPHTVIGVLPHRFWFGDMNSPVWTALDVRTLAADDGLDVVARRPAGMSERMLETRLAGGVAEYVRGLPSAERELRVKASGVGGTPSGKQMAFILPYILAASVLLTLLIACANVAILMIAQWTAREHEIAIRASIGASRSRIVRTLLTESVLIAALGGAVGVGATLALRAWIISSSPGAGADDQFMDLSINPFLFLQIAVVTVFAGVTAGLAPALYETRRLHANPLRSLGASDRVRQRWRHALVVAEISVTVALFVETAAMIDGYLRVRKSELGYATRPLIVVSVENPAGLAIGPTMDALTQVPGVAAVAGGTVVPFRGSGRTVAVAAGGRAVRADRSAITTGFFTTLGVAMRAGRSFAATDSPAARVVIVNETAARQLFPAGGVVGRRLWIEGTPHDVVGVVADYALGPAQAAGAFPKIFVPLPADTANLRSLNFLVRTESESGPLVQPLRRQAQQATAGASVLGAFTFDEILTIIGQEMLIGTAPLVPLIAIGSLLTTAGIYGVLAFAITRRSRELAVRMALGAMPRDIVRLVTAHTVRLAGAGAGLGIGFTFVLSRVVRASGGAGSIFDPAPAAFAWPVVALIVLAAAATWIPSRRAVKIDPAAVLKAI